MPRLNLKDDEFEGEATEGSDRSVAPPPTLREVGSGGGKSPLLLIILIVLALAAAVFALNYFKVIHLWGKKVPAVTESLPEPDLPMPEQAVPAEGGGEPAPAGGEQNPALAPATVPEPENFPQVAPPQPVVKETRPAKPAKPAVSVPSAGHGDYTIQVSSWMNRGKAEQEAAKLSSAGMESFVEEAIVNGATWYRVRVGHYPTSQEAKEAAAQLQGASESMVYVAKVGK
jgi:cell division septation protein DedD